MSVSSGPVKEPKGVIARVLVFLFKLIALVLVSAVVSIIVEWVGMTYFYPQRGYVGYEHAQMMMHTEFSYLSSYSTSGINYPSWVSAIMNKVTEVYAYLVANPQFFSILTTIDLPFFQNTGVERYLRSVVIDYYTYGVAASYILVMFFIRFCILMLSMPAFLLFGFVGVTDGLMQRDLRRWSGGLESGYVYHWAKTLSWPALIGGWVVYLSIPFSIHPNWVITPFSISFGLMVMVMASKFKKYL